MTSKITDFIKFTLSSILRHPNRKWLAKILFGNTLGNIIVTEHVRRKSQHCCEEINLLRISWLLLLYNSCLTFSLVKTFVCITLSIHYYSCSTNKSITIDLFIVCLFEGNVRLSCKAPTINDLEIRVYCTSLRNGKVARIRIWYNEWSASWLNH